MSLTVSTNTAALRAGTAPAVNQNRLQKVFDRLSSGKKLTSPVDNPGGLSVSMKLSAAINRISGAQSNVQNAISFMEVQDGMLDTVGRIVDRMSELKGLSSQDPMKSEQDRASYNNEFQDLQSQLYDISQMKFNGVSMFARYTEEKGAIETVFAGASQSDQLDNTLTIYTGAEGAIGSKVSVHKSLLLSALTFNTNGSQASNEYGQAANGSATGAETGKFLATFATASGGTFLNLADISVGVITKALENIAFLRAQNGGVHSPGLQLGIIDPAKNQYACCSWSNGRCGYGRRDHQLSEVFGTLSGIRIDVGTGQRQYGDCLDAT